MLESEMLYSKKSSANEMVGIVQKIIEKNAQKNLYLKFIKKPPIKSI